MASWVGVVTNAGKSLFAAWVSGTTFNFNAAEGGTGTVTESALLAQTALSNKKQDISIIGSARTEDGIKLTIQITAPESGYTLNQIGIKGSVDGGVSALCALFQSMDGVTIPSVEQTPDFVYKFFATVQLSNTGTFTVTLDTSALVSRSEQEEAISTHNASSDAHADIRELADDAKTAAAAAKSAADAAQSTADGAQSAAEAAQTTANNAASSISTHISNAVTEEAGVHGLRYYNDMLAYYGSGAWTEIKTAPSFVYNCTGTADSTAIADIVNDFFNNGTAMSMKIIISGTMGIEFTNTYYAMYIDATNTREAVCHLDFSDCDIPEITTATRDFLYILGSPILYIYGLSAVSTRHVVRCDGTSISTFIRCKFDGGSFGVYCKGESFNKFLNCTLYGKIYAGCGADISTNSFINCLMHAGTQTICFDGSANNTLICCTISGGIHGVAYYGTGSGLLNLIGCKIIGSNYGVISSSANTSTVIKLTDCQISGDTYAVYQSTTASTMHWLIKGCSFNTANIYVNGTTVSVGTTVANAYLAIQAYHNLFSQTIS